VARVERFTSGLGFNPDGKPHLQMAQKVWWCVYRDEKGAHRATMGIDPKDAWKSYLYNTQGDT